MLKCKDMATHASDHLDGQLTWRQSLGFGVHLLACGYCRHFLRHLRTTIAYARVMSAQDSLPEDEAKRIAERALDTTSSQS